MVPPKKILLPVDLHERWGAAPYAGMLACRFRSEVTILHVVPRGDYLMGSFDVDWRTEAIKSARDSLDSFARDEFRNMAARRVVLEGDPAIEIVKFAHSEGAHLIVMPTHGYGPFRRFILGSVTAKVLHDTDCPVLTSGHMEEPPPPATLFRNILCAIDLGRQSGAALAWAGGIAAELDARLCLVHALPPLGEEQARRDDPAWQAELMWEQIDKLQQQAGTKADVFVVSGDVPKVVRSVAERVNADLVVIGRHVDSRILGRLREHAYAIVRESPCTVVSV